MVAGVSESILYKKLTASRVGRFTFSLLDSLMKQRTILREATVSGKSLHTGEAVTLTLKPAPEDHGIVFRRVDLLGKPEIKPQIDLVTDLVRQTTIEQGHTKLHTIEHVLSALSGCGIDNALVELNASEPPIMDGSAKFFVNFIQEAEPVEQEKDREYIELTEPVSVSIGSSSIIALPYDGFKITCTSADNRGIHSQHLSLDVDPETYISQIAQSRTFVVYEDIEELLKLGKIRGGSLDSAIVLKGDKIMSKEPLRFPDELVRHKMLDIVGDLSLLGKPLKAHIVAILPGHRLNAELCKAIKERLAKAKAGTAKPKKPSAGTAILPTEKELDIRRVLDTLPHRYPFIMIDRVVSFDSETALTAIKNVTINEPFFQGHYPGRPVMPGVLQIEAMAQAAGILLLRRTTATDKVAFFMSCDKVKFRRPVEPGDQLEIKVQLTKTRGSKIGVAEGKCLVGGKVVSNAELMFTIADATSAD